MPDTKPPTQTRERPASQPAALAALSISESLILALIESGTMDAKIARRCLLDAVAAYERRQGAAGKAGAVETETARLIDSLVRQIEAAAPSRRGEGEMSDLDSLEG